MSEVHKALAEWVDVYKANEVKALMGPDAVQALLDEYEAERRARQEAETRAEELRNVLKHCLYRLEDNVQCLQSAGYYAERDVTKVAVMRAQEVLDSTDAGKRMLQASEDAGVLAQVEGREP